jgi:hypothetical protein
VAPEVLRACAGRDFTDAPLPTFTKESDNFALAIHVFRLLMNGFNPYIGINDSVRVSQASPAMGNEAVKRDEYCFKPGKKPYSVAIPPLTAMPEEIRKLFTRAFIAGTKDPRKRPNAAEWHKALENYKNTLKTCNCDPYHQYGKHLTACPWCETDKCYANAMSPKLKQQSLQTPLTANAPLQSPPSAPYNAQNVFTSSGVASPQTNISVNPSAKSMAPRQRLIFITDIVNIIMRNLIYGCFVGAVFMALLSCVYGIWMRGVYFAQLPEFLYRVYYWHIAFPPRTTEGTFHTLLILSTVVPILFSVIPPVAGRIAENSGKRMSPVLPHEVSTGFAFFAVVFRSLFPGLAVGAVCLYIVATVWELKWGIRILAWPPPMPAMLSAGIPIAFFIWRAINRQLRSPMPVASVASSILHSLCTVLCAVMGFFAGFVAVYAELSTLDTYNRNGYTATWSIISAITVALISNKNRLGCKGKIVIAIMVSVAAAFTLNRFSAMMH